MTRQTGRTRRLRLDQARAGELPAEALDTRDGEALLYDLWQAGLCDVEIALHTMWSTYTVGRIRDRLGLAANSASGQGQKKGAA